MARYIDVLSSSLTGCFDVSIEILKASLNIYVDRNRWKVVVGGMNTTGVVVDVSLC